MIAAMRTEVLKEWPDLCPFWAYQLHRHITGDFSGPKLTL